MVNKPSVGVLYGGFSAERPISLKSGRAVAKALKGLGYPVRLIDVRSRRAKGLSGIDVAFIALHGEFGEDGGIQKLLEKKRIPYTGSGPKASGLAMDKFLTKRIFQCYGVPTAPARFIMFSTGRDYKNIGFDYPVVIKPRAQGSSVGVSIARNYPELVKGLKQAARYGRDILVEQYCAGRELTVAILGDQALPLIELKLAEGFFDYNAKYKDKRTEYIVKPRWVTRRLCRRIQAAALKAYRVLGCKGFARVDIIYSLAGKISVLEVNSIPGMTERSLVPKAARAVGIAFPQLCERVIRMALK
ncbi:MAG: D-alanine--D-alanine ligase [Planctomycetes bacterium]|nr:D-alanine--D-alanine ligase [Planctomycetota bacterium]